MSTVTIRPCLVEDYPAVIALRRTTTPDFLESVEEMLYEDASRVSYCLMERWVAELDGELVGFASYYHLPSMYHPAKFWITVEVQPARRGQGIGKQLYAYLLEQVAVHNPLVLRTYARDDMGETIGFLERHGFREEMRDWESQLDVAHFDAGRYAGHEEKVLARGIELSTLKAYRQANPGYAQALYAAYTQIHEDVPGQEPYTPPAFDSWQKKTLADPRMVEEAFILALHNGAIVGFSQLGKASEPEGMLTGVTGVSREYRRMGIALALKLRVIAYAKAHGIAWIRTDNDSTNQGMLSINDDLGFVRDPAWIGFIKYMREE